MCILIFVTLCTKSVHSLTGIIYSGKRIKCVTNNYLSLEMDAHCVSQMTAVNWIVQKNSVLLIDLQMHSTFRFPSELFVTAGSICDIQSDYLAILSSRESNQVELHFRGPYNKNGLPNSGIISTQSFITPSHPDIA